jgi:MFS family permease
MWLKDTSNEERKTLIAAFAGFGTDAFDYMIYSMLIPTLIAVWGMTNAQAGSIATGALITSAVGGWAAGVLADKYGRVRMLQLTVLWFSFFTFLSGFTASYEQLFVTRALQGLGFGGEWSVGSVLVAEMIQARHRGKAVGLVQSSWAVGWGGAAIAFWAVYALVAPELAWRLLFWLGVLPALLILYFRRNLKDPEVYHANRAKMKQGGNEGSFLEIFSPQLFSTTLRASLLVTGMQGAYYAVTTWVPTYLKTERQLSVLNTSGYLLVLILGSFLGVLTGAYLSDGIGRRRCFMLFACSAVALIVIYTQIPITNSLMLLLGLPFGFILNGIFGGIGAYLSELFPNRLRGSGQGFCYNAGRAVGSIGPALVGYLSDLMPLGIAIAYMAGGAYLLVILSVLTLPETRGRELMPTTDPVQTR